MQVLYFNYIIAILIRLHPVTSFPLWASILSAGAIATLYTTFVRRNHSLIPKVIHYDKGGMKAVIWTDVFQGVVMMGGLLTIIIMGTVDVGGSARVFELCRNGSRLNFFK